MDAKKSLSASACSSLTIDGPESKLPKSRATAQKYALNPFNGLLKCTPIYRADYRPCPVLAQRPTRPASNAEQNGFLLPQLTLHPLLFHFPFI